VTLHDVGRTEHGPFLVLELLRGRTLGARLDEGPVGVREALRVAVAVARALAHAHGHGVVHRDPPLRRPPPQAQPARGLTTAPGGITARG
jgi:serine/threonine protein kinase